MIHPALALPARAVPPTPAEAVAEGRYRMICINDDYTEFEFEEERRLLIASFEKILPQKCSFER
mgnify:CR=1 FL=1